MSIPIVLGTAEFNPSGYADILPLETNEIRKIFACAKEAGIRLIDTAESYNCHSVIKKYAKGFCIYDKTRDWKVHLEWGDNEFRGILYHYGLGENKVQFPYIHRWLNLGASVYSEIQLPEPVRILQIPFNIADTRFIECFTTHRTVFIRSVFGRGELLKKYSVKTCLDFVKGYRSDGVIVGVKHHRELEEIVKYA